MGDDIVMSWQLAMLLDLIYPMTVKDRAAMLHGRTHIRVRIAGMKGLDVFWEVAPHLIEPST